MPFFCEKNVRGFYSAKNISTLDLIQQNFNGSNPDGSFTLPDQNSFLGPVVTYKRLLLSNSCIYVFMLLFSFSISKIENETNNTKLCLQKSHL